MEGVRKRPVKRVLCRPSSEGYDTYLRLTTTTKHPPAGGEDCMNTHSRHGSGHNQDGHGKHHNKIREKGLSSRLIMQIHDELVFEVPHNEAGVMEGLSKMKMEQAVSLLCL